MSHSTAPGSIRRANMGDLQALTDIYNQAIRAGGCTAHTRPLSCEARRPWLETGLRDETPIFVWEEAGRVLGYAGLGAYRPGRQALAGLAELYYYIDFSSHGRGIGRRLAEHALEAARALGYTHAVAILLSGNGGSLALLARLGFAQWGCLPGVARLEGGCVRDHLYYGRAL